MLSAIAMQISVLAILLLAVMAGSGLLVGSLVVLLVPITGLAAALAIVGSGFLFVALAFALYWQSIIRAARARREVRDSIVGLAELALALLPKSRLRRLEAGLAAGIGLAALAVLLLRPESDKES